MEDSVKEALDRHWKILWNVQLGIRYHMHLQNPYSRFGKFVTAFTLILSTTAGATIISTNLEIAKAFAFAAAVLQIFELVIDSKSKTILHTNLRQRYINLASELASSDRLQQSEFSSFSAQIASIEVDEPPINPSLSYKCHNDLINITNIENPDNQLKKMSLSNCLIAWYYS